MNTMQTAPSQGFIQPTCIDMRRRGGQGGPPPRLNAGQWTRHEEAYVDALVQEFQSGHLALNNGTSLRKFLANMLHCLPKRISKKFEGRDYANGKRFFEKSKEKLEPEDLAVRQKKITDLERKYKGTLVASSASFVTAVGTDLGARTLVPQLELVEINPALLGFDAVPGNQNKSGNCLSLEYLDQRREESIIAAQEAARTGFSYALHAPTSNEAFAASHLKRTAAAAPMMETQLFMQANLRSEALSRLGRSPTHDSSSLFSRTGKNTLLSSQLMELQNRRDFDAVVALRMCQSQLVASSFLGNLRPAGRSIMSMDTPAAGSSPEDVLLASRQSAANRSSLVFATLSGGQPRLTSSDLASSRAAMNAAALLDIRTRRSLGFFEAAYPCESTSASILAQSNYGEAQATKPWKKQRLE